MLTPKQTHHFNNQWLTQWEWLNIRNVTQRRTNETWLRKTWRDLRNWHESWVCQRQHETLTLSQKSWDSLKLDLNLWRKMWDLTLSCHKEFFAKDLRLDLNLSPMKRSEFVFRCFHTCSLVYLLQTTANCCHVMNNVEQEETVWKRGVLYSNDSGLITVQWPAHAF